MGDFNGDGRTDLVAVNSVTNDVTVLLGESTATDSLLSTTASSIVAAGTPVPLTLTVFDSGFSAPTGAATFLDGTTVLGAATQTTSPYNFSATGLAAGAHTLTATYSGDSRSSGSTSDTVTVIVSPSVSTLTISSLMPASARPGGSDFILTVNGSNFVSGATAQWGTTALTTTFVSATQLTAVVAAAQIATAGAVAITVVNTGPISSSAATFTVTKTITVTMLVSSASSSVFGQPITLTANVSPAAATGNVTFYEGSTVLGIGTLSGGAAQLGTTLLPTGSGTLKAYYAGDVNYYPSEEIYAPSTSQPIALTVTANPSGTLTQASGSPIAIGPGPTAIAAGDFNGDGIQDIAIANSSSLYVLPNGDENRVTILLGNSSGGFSVAPGSPFSVGTNPTSVAVGDFNGDGIQDLAIANGGGGDVTILLGNGSGGFSAASGSPFAVGAVPISVAVGDFNGDGIEDLATANYSSHNVTVLLGNGAGGFSAATGSPFAVGTNPYSVAVGDFNGDGFADLATANFGSSDATVLLGNGSGGFSAATGSPFAAGTEPFSVAMGDFNGDGVSDLVIAGGDTVTVLLGNRSGIFSAAPGSPFAVAPIPIFVSVGDFNGDGIPDLAITSFTSSDVTVFLGNGSGGFSAAPGGPFYLGMGSGSVAVGDFNGDGRTDLVSANNTSNNITVLLGGSAATTSVLSTAAPSTVAAGTPIPLTLTVSDSVTALNAPTGNVTFSDGSTVLGVATQTVSPYAFTTGGLAVGSHTLTATYSGDTRSLGSNSNSITIKVGVPQTIRFRCPAHSDCWQPALHAQRFRQFRASGGVCLKLNWHLYGVGKHAGTGRGRHLLHHRQPARR